jgi:hypothetical protein
MRQHFKFQRKRRAFDLIQSFHQLFQFRRHNHCILAVRVGQRLSM